MSCSRLRVATGYGRVGCGRLGRQSCLQNVRKECEYLAGALMQHLALRMKSCLRSGRKSKSVNVSLAPLRSHELWQSGLWPFWGQPCLQRARKSVNVCLVGACVQHLVFG